MVGDSVGFGAEQVRQRAREDARNGRRQRDDGDVGGGGGGREVCRWRRVQRADEGAEVVDESLAGAGDEEEARGEQPHGGVVQEAAGLFVEEPGLHAAGFGFCVALGGGGPAGVVAAGRVVEEAAGFEAVDGGGDEGGFVDDTQKEGPCEAYGEEQRAEEEEVAEDVDVALGAVGEGLVEEARADLGLPHAAEAEAGDGDGEGGALVLAAAEVLGAGGHRREIHAAGAGADGDEGEDHEGEGEAMAAGGGGRAALVGEGGEEVAGAEEQGGEEGEGRWAAAVDEQAEEGDEEVERELGDDGDRVDLRLGVVEAGLEEGRVQGEGGDGTAGQTERGIYVSILVDEGEECAYVQTTAQRKLT